MIDFFVDTKGGEPMLETEYSVHKEHLEEFLSSHKSEFVVIQGRNVKGFFPTEAKALESVAAEALGTYFVKQCLPLDQTIVDYHSRAIFA